MTRYTRDTRPTASVTGAVQTPPHHAAMVSYFDGARTRAGYRGAISPDLAPWATLIGRVTAYFDLAEYPQDEFRLALGAFRDQHGRDANPTTQDDWPEVAELVIALGGLA